MRKWLTAMLILAAVLAAGLTGIRTAGAEEKNAEAGAEGENTAEWTVLFYMCGSDLESRFGYATENLEEIAACAFPQSLLAQPSDRFQLDYDRLGEMVRKYGFSLPEEDLADLQVNILVETGGSREWHSGALGLDADPGSLQRWRYHLKYNPEGTEAGYTLEQSLPLASMADPRTLADFIRWGTEKYPARKYALVLWGHGGGAKTGMFIDELFGGDYMRLDELQQALKDGGTELEAVLFDACMMANIETAWNIRNSARWMIASEEMVPGDGTHIEGWLQELINNPQMDGMQLGRTICEKTQIKYSDLNNEQAQRTLTWSVIDLSKVDPLTRDLHVFMLTFATAAVEYPKTVCIFSNFMYNAERYDVGDSGMRDIASMLYNDQSIRAIDVQLRNRLIHDLIEMVPFSLRGAGRSRSRGLSFCNAFGFSAEELDVFAKNCPDPCYLSLLDAATESWTAPDWVYEETVRLPELDKLEEIKPVLECRRRANGIPGLFTKTENSHKLLDVSYELFRLDQMTGQIVSLGRNFSRCIESEEGYLWSAIAPEYWWAMEGELCSVEAVGITEKSCLYNIPISMDNQNWYLRFERTYQRYLTEDLEGADALSSNVIYGLWEGYDDQNDGDTRRNILPLPEKAGQEFRLLYPVMDANSRSRSSYMPGKTMTMLRSMPLEEKMVPIGTYYLQYCVTDTLLNKILLDPIEMNWNGSEWVFPEGFTWDGEIEIP